MQCLVRILIGAIMKRKMSYLGAAGLLGALGTAVIAPAPAQAASAPTTSPAAASRVYHSTWGFTCESGYACASVPYGSGWYVFKFYNYGTYSLSNWFGTDTAFNDQTGGAAMRLSNGSDVQVECIAGQTPEAHFDTDVNWTPIYKIRLTASTC
jgi:hypothetical protein